MGKKSAPAALQRLRSPRRMRPGHSFTWGRAAYVAAIVAVGALLAPISCPIFSPENYLRYQAVLHIPPVVAERQNNGPLPQYFADEFGWENMVQQVARVYNR